MELLDLAQILSHGRLRGPKEPYLGFTEQLKLERTTGPLVKSFSPTSLFKQDSLEHKIQDCVQMDLEYLKRRRYSGAPNNTRI